MICTHENIKYYKRHEKYLSLFIIALNSSNEEGPEGLK